MGVTKLMASPDQWLMSCSKSSVSVAVMYASWVTKELPPLTDIFLFGVTMDGLVESVVPTEDDF